MEITLILACPLKHAPHMPPLPEMADYGDGAGVARSVAVELHGAQLVRAAEAAFVKRYGERGEAALKASREWVEMTPSQREVRLGHPPLERQIRFYLPYG